MQSTRAIKPLPSTFVSKTIVNERVSNFQNGKHVLLSADLGRPDSKAAWYSIYDLEELVRELHFQNADGLRIYFGAYDNSDPLYGGQLTIIFVPTCTDPVNGKHKDVILESLDDFTLRRAAEDELKSLSRNFDTIGLCPPSCGAQELSYPLDLTM